MASSVEDLLEILCNNLFKVYIFGNFFSFNIISVVKQMIAANVLSKEEFPDFDDETGILPKVDDEEGKIRVQSFSSEDLPPATPVTGKTRKGFVMKSLNSFPHR